VSNASALVTRARGNRNRVRLRNILGPVVWLVGIACYPLLVNEYYQGLATTVGITAILAVGLVLITGYAGQFSLAAAAFYGIGAYGSALLTVKMHVPGLVALVASALAATALAYAIGRPIFRLRGHFLAMGTLALTEIFYLLFNNLSFTGGSSGFGSIEPLSIFGKSMSSTRDQFYLAWVVLGLALWATIRIGKSREGRALRALRGHEAAAAACGINVAWAKTRIFAGSAFVSSVAGSLYAHQLLYVNPPPFGVLTSIDILAIIVLGGMAGPWGAIIGSILMTIISQVIQSTLPSLFGAGSVGAGESLALGLLLVVILILRPDGVTGAVSQFVSWVRRRTRTSPHGDSPDMLTDSRDGAQNSSAVDVATPNPDRSSGEQAESVAFRARRDVALKDEVVLSCRDLTKTFGGVRAVDHVDLELRSGEILAVIGPNGAGKSTLLNLLSGNLPPTEGTIQLLSHDVTRKPAFYIASRGLARTFQTPSLFRGMNAQANVLVGAHLRGTVGLIRAAVPTPAAVREESRLACEIDEVMSRLGLVHLATREATELSLGQQKMLEVARAVAQRPRILLLDEPGAGLNRVEKLALADQLRGLRSSGVSLLLIEHDMEFVMSLADRVHVLDFGRTLTVGTPQEVQSNPDVIDAYLGVEDHSDEHADLADGNVDKTGRNDATA